MKYFKYRISFFLLTIFSLSACEDYLDINDNPNNPPNVPSNLLLANATYRTGDNIQLAGNITSYYVQYLASPNPGGSKDTHEPQPYDVTWEEMYRMLSDLADLELVAEEENARHYVGAAKILKAINLGLVLDLWGDVPYSEAFFAEVLQPAYDNDEDLYTELLSLLDEGIAELSTPDQTILLGSDDFIYNGDVSGWIKMAYALKARYLLHMSKTSKFDANAVLAAVASAISSNAENADITYSDAGSDVYNPWAKVARSQENSVLDGWISAHLADAMNGTTFGVADPRMPFMFGATTGGEFIGVVNGAGRGTDVAIKGQRSTLMRGTYYASDNSPIHIITFAEVKFIEAEAALANNDKPRAYQAYLDGIAAHMNMVGVTDPSTYISNPVVSVGEANINIDLIMKEKYVAMFLHPETWNDARRYNYQYTDMNLPVSHNPALGGQFIRRLVYPDSEISRNLKNVPSVTVLDRLWWDQ